MTITVSQLKPTFSYINNNKPKTNNLNSHAEKTQTSYVNQNYYKIYFGSNNFAVKKLPAELQENRKASINETIKYIASNKFYNEKIEGKNWKDEKYLKNIIKYSQDEEWLRERADLLLKKAYFSLEKPYKNNDTIVFAWAGGRDSSSLLASSLAFFPDKKYRLLTVLNGMSTNFENPRTQFNRLKQRITPEQTVDIKHYYVDKIADVEEHTINSAKDDKKILGSPAICSSCKVVIEKSLAKAAKQLGANNLMLGYSKYQGLQDWIEQTPEQIDFMKKVLEENGVKQVSPLYDVLEYPFDSALLLASLGIPLSEHKLEMKCKAGGLNPQDLDYKKLNEFLTAKNIETSYLINKPVDFITEIEADKKDYYSKLVPDVVQLREDKQYREGVFEERKYNGK